MIVITSSVKDMQSVLNMVWDKLLPAMKSSPLAPDDQARKKLEDTVKGLSLRTPEGGGAPAKVSGTSIALVGHSCLPGGNARPALEPFAAEVMDDQPVARMRRTCSHPTGRQDASGSKAG